MEEIREIQPRPMTEQVEAILRREALRTPENQMEEVAELGALRIGEISRHTSELVEGGKKLWEWEHEENYPPTKGVPELKEDLEIRQKFEEVQAEAYRAEHEAVGEIVETLVLNTPETKEPFSKDIPGIAEVEGVHERARRFRAREEGMVMLREDMRKIIRENPKASLNELLEDMRAEADKLEMDEAQRKLMEYGLRRYRDARIKLEHYLENYPEPKTLFKKLFGEYPKGAIEVVPGAVTILFRCHDFEDFLRIASGDTREGEIFHHPEFVKKARQYQAMYIKGSHETRASGLVIAEFAEGAALDGEALRTYVHEEQHAFNHLVNGPEHTPPRIRWEGIRIASPEAQRKKVEEYMLEARAEIEEELKDEFLAYYRSHPVTPERIREELMRSRREGGYGFMEAYELYEELPAKELGKGHEAMIREVGEEVFHEALEKMLRDAVYAVHRVELLGKAPHEIVKLFEDKPFSSWKEYAHKLSPH